MFNEPLPNIHDLDERAFFAGIAIAGLPMQARLRVYKRVSVGRSHRILRMQTLAGLETRQTLCSSHLAFSISKLGGRKNYSQPPTFKKDRCTEWFHLEIANEEVRKGSGTQFDPDLSAAFTTLWSKRDSRHKAA